jgi:uncharacterized protein (TIGR01370 family)
MDSLVHLRGMAWRFVLRLVALLLIALPGTGSGRRRWVAYYSDQAPVEDFRDYGLVVFDSDRQPPLAPLATPGRILLGYLSLGEIADGRAYFQEVKQEGLLIKESPTWPGSHSVDVRDPRWRRRVIEQLVPGILARGFQGVFLDTLDNPVEIERRDPKTYRGMAAAAAELIKALRQAFPTITIMMNRGYGLLPDVAGSIDIVLGESVYSTYDFERKTYRLVPTEGYREQVRLLKEAKQRHQGLRICSLDYWDPIDLKGIRRIYREERANGFEPYVATIGLDRIVEEPR